MDDHRTRNISSSLEKHKDLICHHLLSRDSALLENLLTSGLIRLEEVEMMKRTKDVKTMGEMFVRMISEKGETGFQHLCSELERENPGLLSKLLSSTAGTASPDIVNWMTMNSEH